MNGEQLEAASTPIRIQFVEREMNTNFEVQFCNLKITRFEYQLREMVEGVFPVMEVMRVFIDLPDVRHIVLF
jgi:hypothetical protein